MASAFHESIRTVNTEQQCCVTKAPVSSREPYEILRATEGRKLSWFSDVVAQAIAPSSLEVSQANS